MRPMLQVAAAALCLGIAGAQTPPAQNTTELTTHDEQPTFRARVNLVTVPVVVRDRQGRAVGNLRQEDFQLFDKGKLQSITRFSIERPGSRTNFKPAETADGTSAKAAEPGNTAAILPERFVAYLFDDIHLSFGDMVHARDAARRHLDTLGAVDRAAIYTTSGQGALDFTDDRDRLREALTRLAPRPIARSGTQECPDISYYMADLIHNRHDTMALSTATRETMACADIQQQDVAREMAESKATQVLAAGEQETRVAMAVLRDTVRRLAAAPGQRTIVLVSPGFLTPDSPTEKMDILDRAIKANVIINALDARGLDPRMPDISKRVYEGNAERIKQQYDRDAASAQSDVLAEMAHGTGGTFFENSNDMDAGFRRLADTPEYYYVLGFAPQNLKVDGSFHALKVTLKNPGGLSAQARRGYYAPRRADDAAETSRREIEEATFSREEMHELPVDLHTQFFKPSDTAAKVSVVMHVDLRKLRFRKGEGRNYNNLTVVAALFDRNGSYVTGVQKRLEMRLLDATLEKRGEGGLTLRSTLDVKPGVYAVRLVVRDSEGDLMSAENGVVDIP